MTEIINKSNEKDRYLSIIYKQIKDKKEKIKNLKENGFKFYDKKEYEGNVLRIFGKDFVKQNKNKCKIVYGNKKYKLKEYFEEIGNNYTHNFKEIK